MPAAPTVQAETTTVLRGIVLMLAAGFMFVLMDATAKHLAQTYSVTQVAWARYVFHMVTLPVLFGRHRWTAVLRTPRLGLQLARSVLLLASTFLFFLAVKFIPLADATAIGFVGPLLVTALSVPLLGERVGWRRWAAVIVGFAGVLVIIRPGFGMLHWAVVLPLLVAVCFALYQIGTRVLSRTDGWTTTLFYSASVGVVAMSAAVPFQWRTPDLAGWAAMAFLGLMGSLGHLAMIRAFAAAPASTLAPFVSRPLHGFPSGEFGPCVAVLVASQEAAKDGRGSTTGTRTATTRTTEDAEDTESPFGVLGVFGGSYRGSRHGAQ